MINEDCPYRRIGPEAVFAGSVVSVPRDDVERTVRDPSHMKLHHLTIT
jgi:hypothetical protein